MLVDFNPQKIVNAVNKALKAAKVTDSEVGQNIADSILKNKKDQISIEEIHDAVETGLMAAEFHEAAKRYILYRHDKKQKLFKEREEKKKALNITGQLDPVSEKFSVNAVRLLASRYLVKDKDHKPIETPTDLFERIPTHIGAANVLYDERLFDKEGKQDSTSSNFTRGMGMDGMADSNIKIGKYKLNNNTVERLWHLFGKLHEEGKMRYSNFNDVLSMITSSDFAKYEKTIKTYYDLMATQRFMPNTPTIANAGTALGQLSACFVLPMDDKIESIMDTAKNMAIIFKSGGGVGINYSKLREEGALVASTSGTSSGPLSFMNIINTVTDTVKQGGRRRGANMGIMNSHHPDVEKFIHAKETKGVLENFNVSVGTDAEFFNCLKTNTMYHLKSPQDGKQVKAINSRDMFSAIAQSAWKSAEPGMIFFDNVNKYNVMTPIKGDLDTTNPCGEQALYPYESCNLGSINLAKFVKNGLFDWEEFGKIIELTTDFLDNVIDMNKYPVYDIDVQSWNTRRIGLGIMGLADLLYILEIPYNSEEGFKLQEQIAQFLTFKSLERSVKLAKLRGSFPYYSQSLVSESIIDVAGYFDGSLTDIVVNDMDWLELTAEIKEHGLRNVHVTTVAPTGSIGMIADTSTGVEPVFALAFEKKVTVGSFIYVNHYLEAYLKKHNIYYDNDLLEQVAKYGSIQGTDLPDEVKRIFVTSMDIHWIDHVFAQAVWQRWITNSISKTINMPNNVTAEDVSNAYYFAHEIGCKGITVYRDGSRHEQVLHVNTMENKTLVPSVYGTKYYKQCVGNTTPDPTPTYHVLNEITTLVSGANEESTNMRITIKTSDKDICPNCKGPTQPYDGCIVCLPCGVTFC